MNVIRSKGHELFTEQINKVALLSADDRKVFCVKMGSKRLLMDMKKWILMEMVCEWFMREFMGGL